VKDRELGPGRRRVPGYRMIAVRAPSVHHGMTSREGFVEAEIRELARRPALERAMRERRRITRDPGSSDRRA